MLSKPGNKSKGGALKTPKANSSELKEKKGENAPAPKGILKKPKTRDSSKTEKKHDKKSKKSSRKPASENPFTSFDDVEMSEAQQGKKPSKVKPHNNRKKVKRVFTKKERRQARLNSKKHSEVVPVLLADWEILRRESTEAEKKFELVQKMLECTKSKLMDLSRARDTSRIIESMIQWGTEAQRWVIFAELKDRLRYLAMSQYGKHVVLKLINYGAKEHRLELFKLFRGHVARLLRHRHAAEVVEVLYNDYATASQRAFILQETYGQQFALQLTANNVTRLQQALELNPDKRATILTNLNDLLITVVNKGLMRLSIVQHLLLEYLTIKLESSADLLKMQSESAASSATAAASKKLVRDENDDDVDKEGGDGEADEEEGDTTASAAKAPREERLSALVEAILEAGVVSMLHTREGIKAALAVLWICPPKERKTLLKSLRTCVVATAENEHGHIFLMGLLDAVDDTKLLAKTVIKELLEDLEDVVAHPHARKVLLYALSPRHQRHFAPALVSACLAGGDDSPFTKKPLAAKALELRSPLVGLLPALLKLASGENLFKLFVGNEEYPAALEDRSRLVLLSEILLRSSAYELQLSTAADQFKRGGTREADRLAVAQTVASLAPADLAELTEARAHALTHVVHRLLAEPDFKPVGLASSDSAARSVEARRRLQTQRRKRALAIAESEGVKKRKVTVKAFTNTEDDDDDKEEEAVAEPMETSTSQEEEEETTAVAANAPFLERPEGQLMVNRLLQSEKKSGAHDFARLICDLVPKSNLQAWLTCNRTCFTLVHLYELNDEEICKKLKAVLGERKDLITASPLPGAKVLAKHLFGNRLLPERQ